MDVRENEEFTQCLRNAVLEAEKLKYFPNRFKGMLAADGGYETVKRILESGKPSDGFQKLWELGRVDLTCEAIIVESKWRRHFDADLLERSENLLRQVDYAFKRYEVVDAGLQADQPGTDEEDFVPPVTDHRDHAAREVALRPWQGQFRDALFERYGKRCCVSECVVAEALEAAHITPYIGEQSNDPRNGLVLRSDLHTLFDRYLFGIDPTTLRVALSDALAGDPTYRVFANKVLEIAGRSAPSQQALEVHWQKFTALSESARHG